MVIEDLISTGKSSLNAVAALQEQRFQVLGMLALFLMDLQLLKKIFSQKHHPSHPKRL